MLYKSTQHLGMNCSAISLLCFTQRPRNVGDRRRHMKFILKTLLGFGVQPQCQTQN